MYGAWETFQLVRSLAPWLIFSRRIRKYQWLQKNAKSPGDKIVDKFIHPLLYLEFHKKYLIHQA